MHYIFFSLLLLLFQQKAIAQNYLNHSHCLGLDDGLSNAIVNQVFQDSRGFMWFATGYGLNRFDAYNFEVFTKEQNGLSENKVNCVAEDFEGNLWLGCGVLFGNINQSWRAIDVLDPISNKVVSLQNFLPGKLPFELKDVWRLQGNSDETIWIMTKKGILFEYNKSGFEQIWELPPSTFFPESAQLFKTAKGNGWASLSYWETKDSLGGLIYFEPKHGILDSFASSVHPISNISLLGSGESIFFQKNLNKKIECYKKAPYQKQEKISFQGGPSYFATKCIPTLKQIWSFGRDGDDNVVDIFDLKGQYLTSFNKGGTMGYNDIIWLDNQQGVWSLNGYHNHICVRNISKSLFQKYHYAPSAEDQRVAMRACFFDEGSNQLFAGGDHLSMVNFSTQKERYFNLTNAPVLSFLQHSNGNLYVSDEDGTIVQWDGIWKSEVLAQYKHPENAGMGNMLWALAEDQQQRIWVGGSSGLSSLDIGTQNIKPFKNYGNYLELSQADIFHFHSNEKGMWLASGTGLYLFDPIEQKIVERYHTNGDADHFLPYNTIAHIYEDQDGLFWLATKGGGIIKWNPQTKEYQQFTTLQGLSHNVTYAIYEDDYSNLWISSDYGIMRFNKKSEIISSYHIRDGITHEEFNTLSHCQLPDGRIIFGGLNGLTVFHPKTFHEQEINTNTQLRLTKLEKRNEETGNFEDQTASLLTKENNRYVIHLNSSEKTFRVHFSLLDFHATQTNSYAYQLKGLDKDWNYIKSPSIPFSNLPYGTYELRLKAQGKNGAWLKEELPITITIHRPFYLQWWFLLLSIFVSLACIYTFIQWRLKRLKERQEELERIVEQRTSQINKDKQIIEQQAEDLKALDKLKTRFFTNISHDLRTPLTLILGPLSSILEQPEILTPQLLAQNRSMNRNGKKLLQLIEEILDLSKLDADKLEVNETVHLFYNFLKRVCSIYEYQITSQKIHFEIKYNLEEDLQLLIDANKLEKIIENLLSNAFKFTKEGETIIISVSKKEEQVWLEVKDNGQGISTTDLPYIFDRFFQSKQTNRPAQGGTGIGLALSQELATLIGGSLSVNSELKKGSTFLLKFPLKETTITNVENDIIKNDLLNIVSKPISFKNTNSSSQKYKILIVEDNDDMRHFIHDLLVPYYDVNMVENGLLAWDFINSKETKINLIVSDVMMPEMDGFTLLKRIKEHEDHSKIPIIMLTAIATERDKLRALIAGVDDYLIKPFSSRELLARIHNVLVNYSERLEWLKKENELTNKVPITNNEELSKKKDVGLDISLSYNEREWIQQVDNYTKKHIYNTSFSVTEIAVNMHISERQFRRVLKKITGLSPSAYIKEIRLDTARQLLEEKKYASVAKVSLSVGFKTTRYFSQQYTNRFGKHPEEY